jgi:hypothetical protein
MAAYGAGKSLAGKLNEPKLKEEADIFIAGAR